MVRPRVDRTYDAIMTDIKVPTSEFYDRKCAPPTTVFFQALSLEILSFPLCLHSPNDDSLFFKGGMEGIKSRRCVGVVTVGSKGGGGGAAVQRSPPSLPCSDATSAMLLLLVGTHPRMRTVGLGDCLDNFGTSYLTFDEARNRHDHFHPIPETLQNHGAKCSFHPHNSYGSGRERGNVGQRLRCMLQQKQPS